MGGGSGYTNWNEYVNMSKTGGHAAAVRGPRQNRCSIADVQNALNYMDP